MSIAYLHLDGVDYELQPDILSTDDEQFVALADLLGRALASAPGADHTAASGLVTTEPMSTGPVSFPVRLQGTDTELLVVPGSVAAGALYLTSRQRGRSVTDVTEARVTSGSPRGRWVG